MSNLSYIDRFQTTLASGYTSGGTTLALTSASGLPTGSCFFFLIIRAEGANTEEVFKVTSISGTTVTGVGAQANTSASNHAAGATVIGSIMTADAFFCIPQNDILSLDKAGGTITNAKIEGVSVAASATTTLLNISSGPGYLSSLAIFLTCTDFSNAAQNSTLKITVDGETAGGTYNDRLPLYFAAEYLYNTGNFKSLFNSGQTNNSNNVGYVSFTPIPFSTSLKIELINGSSSTAMTVWANMTYHTGVANKWPGTRKLRTFSGTLTNQTVNTVETLVNATSLNPGRLLGLYLSIDSFPSAANPVTAPLEGNVKIYLDGAVSPNFESSGTEDYFLHSNYFEQYSLPTANGSLHLESTPYTGLQYAPSSTPSTWNAYRYHIPDKILFANALKVTWNCGDSTQVNFTGGARLAYCGWYYTE